jgi:hypothetical protein
MNRPFIFTDVTVWFRKYVSCNKIKDLESNISITKTKLYSQEVIEHFLEGCIQGRSEASDVGGCRRILPEI